MVVLTSDELLDLYANTNNITGQLGNYIMQLEDLTKEINIHTNVIMQNVFNESGNSNYIAKLNDSRNQVTNIWNTFILNFDLLQFQAKVMNAKAGMSNLINNCNKIPEADQQIFEDLFTCSITVANLLYSYALRRDNKTIFNIIEAIISLINKYNFVCNKYINLMQFVDSTQNKFEKDNSFDTIELHFFSNNDSLTDSIEYLESTNKCYDLLCQIFKVSSSENQLRVVKIESGCLLEKLSGLGKVVDAFAYFLTKSTDLIFSKYTIEGKISTVKQILDVLEQDAKVIEKYKELGLKDIDLRDEDIEKLHYMVIRIMHQMILKSSKIKINGKTLSINEQYEQKFIEESKKALSLEKPKRALYFEEPSDVSFDDLRIIKNGDKIESNRESEGSTKIEHKEI